MDIKQLKEYLIDNTDYIEELLEKYFHNVKYYSESEQWRFGFTESCNPNSIRLSSRYLSYKDYKNNEVGDIFSLFMRRLRINLGKCLDLISNKTCFVECNYIKKKIYDGFFSSITKYQGENLNFFKYEDIESYPEIVSKFLLSEGITIEAQQKFNIRYDYESNRVVIPVYLKGNLIGAIGRLNSKSVGDIPKYLPILRYPKNKVIFGYDINYSSLINNRIYIVESEKTVIKAFGEGFKNLLAIGGNSISTRQKELIYSFNPSEIILVLDKGLGKDRAKELGYKPKEYMKSLIIKELSEIKTNNIFIEAKLGYIDCNDIEEVSDKENIFDLDYCDNIYYDNQEYINYI